jgi:adenine-specific DNA-methyltransferase
MPARKRATGGGATPVEAIVHGDKRANLPTADAEELVTPQVEQAQSVLYERKPELDPQLVWRGKDEQDKQNLEVDAPPIYIQEKIDPRVLVENLRQTSPNGSDEPELTLFQHFDGLDEMELVEFYQHDANWSNRMILGDSLNVMASLAEREGLRGKVQMIYVDPPYGIKFGSNWQVSVRDRDVRDGKLEDAAREVEQIKAFRDTWELGIHSYLSYLRDRLTVARDLLTDSGSAFVQIGDENVHLVRAVMDEVFGSENFVALITFKTTSGAGSFAGGTNVLASVNAYIVWYARDRRLVKYHQLFDAKAGDVGTSEYRFIELEEGTRRPATDEELLNPQRGRLYRISLLTSQTTRVGQTTVFPVTVDGRTVTPRSGGWKTNRAGMERLVAANRIVAQRNSLGYVRYLTDFPYMSINNVWNDTVIAGRPGDKVYVVQTSPKVIERCILMATDPGDLILDPTCGSGTTAFAAEQWGRRWITVDTSRVALALARVKVMSALYPYYLLSDSEQGRQKEQTVTGSRVTGPAVLNDIRHGFVYERVPHVTLKSIANNPDIRVGMTREQIESAIRRHAEYELLYDRPFEDRRRVRVAGPFTVESLSPHRSLAFAPATESVAERDAARDPASVSFEDTIRANLAKAGIQNGKRKERLEFEAVEAYAGTYIQALGTRRAADGAGAARVAISIGPQYGTVGPPFIKEAAREASRNREIDLLCILAFAFDPTALGTADEYTASLDGFASVAAERSLGRVPVLLVRMNADLVMGEDLKKTGAGNLFTVFGEPDIEITRTADELAVEIKGVDVYDPTTGEVRSRDTDHIALWMIDTAYNGESFFVRHCYFTGGMDPYKRLKTALKADINEEAWATLYRTVSRPFPHPDSGRIAIKVINDYGDEVMKVFDV